MEFIIAVVLGILGAALIVGGIVGYRKSESARSRESLGEWVHRVSQREDQG